MEGDSAQGPRRPPSAPSLDERDGHLAARHAEYRARIVSVPAWLAKDRLKLTDGWKPHVTVGIQNFIWITRMRAERQRTEHRQNSGGQVLEGSMVGNPPCAVQGYSASMDRGS